MGDIAFINDRLVNVMTGLGTTADKRSHGAHVLSPVSAQQVEAAYRGSWLMRKAIDLPPYDMTRAWRNWQAKGPQIEALEAEEKRLGLREKVRRALVLARLGGAGMVLWVEGDRQDSPLDPARIGVGGLAAIQVWHRAGFTLGPMIDLWGDPWFGHPAWYEVRLAGTAAQAQPVRFHPSRVVAFRGQEVPGLGLASWQDQFWGDPACQSLQEAVDNAELAQAGFAALVTEARLDIVKMPGLMQNVATEEYRERVLRRFELANLGKSTHRALVLDGEEEWAQRETSWAGIPEIIASYVQIVAGAADIPATRLLGKSPDGMNATGDGDIRNYETMISARQENDLRPLLERIDEVLIRSATGGRDPDIGFTFAPLSLPTAADEAGLFKTSMDAVAALKATGMVPDDALAKGVQNLMVERGWIPGLDGALAEGSLIDETAAADPGS